MSSPRRRIRLTPGWWTTILIATITGGLLLCMARFAGTLNSYVPVTITSDRAGLIMESGAKVKFRGVVVGQVAGVTSQHDKISLALDLFPDQITHIPGNVGAQIRATTVFGAKYVDLVNPAVPSPRPLQAGAVLQSSNVTTEVNTVFQNLVDVLHRIDPPKLNAVLTALSDGVRGQGENIGKATSAANRVLTALNTKGDTALQDWRSLQNFSDVYSTAAPDILATLEAASTTSGTLTKQSSDLNTLLLNMIGFSDAGINLLGPNHDNLVHTINTLQPTTDLLLRYNPEYTCLLTGAKFWLDSSGYQMAGGDGRTVIVDDAFLFGDAPYRYPDNLPIVAAKGGPGGRPSCGSLPDVSKNYPQRQLITNTGWGTGLDIRPNPGIGFPGWANYFPVTRGVPQPPSIRNLQGGPAIGPIPYPGAPPYGAQLYAPDGTPLWPGLPPAPAPLPDAPASAAPPHP